MCIADDPQRNSKLKRTTGNGFKKRIYNPDINFQGNVHYFIHLGGSTAGNDLAQSSSILCHALCCQSHIVIIEKAELQICNTASSL